jgi:hypothetical protein
MFPLWCVTLSTMRERTSRAFVVASAPDCFPVSPFHARGEQGRQSRKKPNEKPSIKPHFASCAMHHPQSVTLVILCSRDHQRIQAGFRLCALRGPESFCFRDLPRQLVFSTLTHE